MSGRSAYVRKVKTNVRDDSAIADGKPQSRGSASESPAFGNYPNSPDSASHHAQDFQPGLKKENTARSVRSTEDDMAYARAKKPQLPNLDISGIEKSGTREKMDKMSENVRKGLSGFNFGIKKRTKEEAHSEMPRPATSMTVHTSPVHQVQDREVVPLTAAYKPVPLVQPHQLIEEEVLQPGPPPQTKLPPLPSQPQMRRWLGNGRVPQPWNKLRKDPELWDTHGDTLIFLGSETQRHARQPPSFRVSSHILESTESRFLIDQLQEGYIDDTQANGFPLSPLISPGVGDRRHQQRLPSQGDDLLSPISPTSERSSSNQDPGGEISYELYFSPPAKCSKSDALRHQIATRNVFALLYKKSLVGMNLYQILSDLLDRMQEWMPQNPDNAGMIIDYIAMRGLNDVRNDPYGAASLLAWTESRSVRWHDGWREAFVHCCGMHDRLDSVNEMRFVSPVTRALLERASLDCEVRIQAVEQRLLEFDFDDIWPTDLRTNSVERVTYERAKVFFRNFYEMSLGSWPPPVDSTGQWLSRGFTKKLQTDFGALYDFLVDRDTAWVCSEASAGRKWSMVHPSHDTFSVDTPELPMTDMLVSFDNRFRYPHIPHPYPLVPVSSAINDIFNKTSKAKPTAAEEKLAERRAALAYTEATNIYTLADFSQNRLVDAFVKFEKTDMPGQVDPCVARRARWVLIYGILQKLASISVDVPAVRFKDAAPYHLNTRLRGTPPWKPSNKDGTIESHEMSYCWTAPRKWVQDSNSSEGDDEVPALEPSRDRSRSAMNGSNYGGSQFGGTMSVRSSVGTVSTESDAGSYMKSPRFTSGQARHERRYPGGAPTMKDMVLESDRETERLNNLDKESARAEVRDHFKGLGFNDYGPGIQKVEDSRSWPIRDANSPSLAGRREKDGELLEIRDFDEYSF